MAGITLRDYIREIEKQIDGKRYDEAIAHCHYILQSYPKAVEVYRLLGKAFLENQRYGDAADIFQRVLSALPDDFVSHAGMSIIREDEGNLDEAIWHMERAFDIQPANSALQEELRRMYGRRDNVEPPKIRLTRSALARMYFKGELYPQAIAETRAALAESPDRLDLLALLTEIYAGAGQKADAVEVAAKLARKLPYCIIANRVLYEMLRSTERDAEAQTYLQRLNQVEPYFAYISETYPTLESVPDSSIRIEKLEWKVGQTAAGKSGQPTWAASLGVDLNELSPASGNQLPDWLGSQNEDESTPAFSLESDTSMDLGFDWDKAAPPATEIAAAGQEQPPSSESGEAIPDWLKDLGWAPATSESRDAEADYHFEEALGTEAVESEINAAELSTEDLAIDNFLAGDASTGSLEAAEMPDWLRNLAPEHAEDEPQGDENLTPWLDKLFTQAGDEPGAAPNTSEETPAMPSETAASPEEEGLPDWMMAGLATGALRAELGTPVEPEAVEPASDMPDWLREIEGKAEVFSATGETDWVQVGAESSETMTEPSGESAEELPAWLLGDESETHPAEGEPAGEAEATDTSHLPAWLFEENEQELAAASTVLPQDMPTEGDEESLPTWLFEGDSAPVLSSNEKLPEEHPEPAAQPADEELPAWLSDEEQPAAAETLEPEPAGEELPAWLLGEDQTTPQEEPAAEQTEEEIPEWLLSEVPTVFSTEAAAQPSDEELPAWLLDEERPGELEEPEAEPAGEGLPAWLLEATPAAEPAESAEQPAEEETPAWLLGKETSVSQPVESELPDWLASMGIQEQRPPEAEAAEEELPEWLTTEEEPAAQETSLDEIPEWLRTGALASAAGDAADWLAAEPQPVDSQASLEAEAASEVELTPPAETPVEPEQPARLARMPDLAEAFAWLALMMTPIQPEAQPAPAEELTIETMVEESAPPDTALPGPQPAEAMQVETELPTFEPAETETIETPATEITSPAETSVSTPPASEAGAFDFPLDSEDAFAWLESLAVKQGAQEALLLTPEERAERPPEWVQHAAEEVTAKPETETPPGEQEPDEQPSLPEDTSELKTGALPTLPEDTSDLKTGELPPLFGISVELPVEPAAEAPGETTEDFFSPWATEPETAPEEPITTRLGDQIMPPAAIEVETADEMEDQVWAPDEEAASPSGTAEKQADTLGETATEPLPRVTWMADTGDIEAASAEIESVVDEELSTPTEKLPNARSAEDVETPAAEDAPPLPDWLAGVDSERPPDMPEWRLPTFTRRRYDLNLASLVELERLPGIGFIMAQRIVDYRDAHGPFERVEDLLQVPEFSRYTLEIIRDNLFVIPTAEQPVRAQPISVRPSTRRPGKSVPSPADITPASEPHVPALEITAPEAVSTGRQSKRVPATPPQQSVPAPVLPDSEPPEVIRQARRLTEQGEWDAALAVYGDLLQAGQHLDWVIADYVSATQARPNDIDLWQNLGDAYLRANRLKEAMNAYSQAEKLLR